MSRFTPVRPVSLLVGATLLLPIVGAPWAMAETTPVAAGASVGNAVTAVRVAAGAPETATTSPTTTIAPGSAGVTARVLPVAPVGTVPSSAGRVASTGNGPATVSTTIVLRYGDPLADLAKGALEALDDHLTARSSALAGTGPATLAGSGSAAAPGLADTSWSSLTVEGISVGTAVPTKVAPSVQAALSVMPNDPQGRYVAALRQVARQTADRAKVDAAQLEQVWLRTEPRRMWTLLAALSQVGTQYRWAGNQPGGFDCSGLTSWAWAQAGVRIPRTSAEQIDAAAPRTVDQLLPGDLLYRPGHIGMYLGVGDAMVNAPRTGKPVEVKRMGTMTRFGSPL